MIASHPLSGTSQGPSAAQEPRGGAGHTEVSCQAAAEAAVAPLPPPTVTAQQHQPPGAARQLHLPPPPPQFNGRPPLPRSVPPSSATSSRVSSPQSAVSVQPSLQTLNMSRVAQYRPASRTFKPDGQPRKGLSTGDVVTFHAQGKLLAATELSSEQQEASTVHFGLQPAEQADGSDMAAHLEVIRQGKWVGFRSVAAGDRFLQARKRSTNRLVFFSQNVGTWEQWELGGGSPDPEAADWASLAVTLRHRRLPQFELAVEMVRVGTYSLPPSAAITPRTLLAASEAASSGVGANSSSLLTADEDPGLERRELKRNSSSLLTADEDPGLERRELKRMSGVLVHEWLHYVDQEKAARLAVEGRMAQMAEDAAGLRDWAVMQLDSVRWEMGKEVDALLAAVQRKSAKLADAESRLTGRLRWGVAMIQAKSEMGIKRQAFMWWRWSAARKRYCRHVEAKLQQRSDLRTMARALQGWAAYTEQQGAVQARLWAAVRRMYIVRLFHAFTAWQDLVAFKRQQEADHAALAEAVCQHMQRWRLRRLLRPWQAHAAGCNAGRQLLEHLAGQAQRRAVASAFVAWRTHLAAQSERLAAFSVGAVVRQRQRAQRAAFQGWRLQADDKYGARLQLQHALQVLARGRLRCALRAWLDCQRQRADRRAHWEATIAYMWQRGAAIHMDAAFAAWQGHVAQLKERRMAFYSAVQHLALHKMSVAFCGWQYLAAWRQHVRRAVEESVVRLSQRSQAHAWAAWQQCIADRCVAHHRIAVCQRRHQAGLQRGLLSGWRQVAAMGAAERQIVQLCQKRADRNRMGLALAGFQANAEAAAQRRALAQLAVSWYAEALQVRVFAALSEAMARRRLFEEQLAAVAVAARLGVVQQAFVGWRAVAALATSESQLVAAAQRRFDRIRLLSRFSAWQAAAQRERGLQHRFQTCVTSIAHMRLAWAVDVWHQRVLERTAEKWQVAAVQRRIVRIRLTATFAGWQQWAADLAAARQEARQRAAAQEAALLQGCLLSWTACAAQQAQQRAAMVHLVHRRVALLTLNAVHSWCALVQHKQQRRAQLQRVVRKLAAVCQRHAFAAWRQQAAWQQDEAAKLAALQHRVMRRLAACSLAAAFRGWRGHTATLSAARAAVDAKVAAESGVMVRHVLAAWHRHTEAQAVRHHHILRVCVTRQSCTVQSKALVTWQLFAQRQAHNREAVELMVHRMARQLMHAALLTWRHAAQERRVRRTAIARFIQRWDTARKSATLSHWRRLLAEKREAADNLKRCLIRKRIAFRLFRQWYWESFDDDMQETLRTMFEITEEAAVDPLPSRAVSPYGSLLTSPIRQQLYDMPRQQQLQLNAGVAEALARPGAMHPAFLRSDDARQDSGTYRDSLGQYGYSGSLGLPHLPPREPLSSRLVAATAYSSGGGSAASAVPPPPANLGGAPLAPLREYAAFTMHSNAMLEPVPEVAESPYARSPAYAAAAAYSASPNAAALAAAFSSASSTVLPGSPLTPVSAFAAGSSPLTGISRLATPLTAGALQVQQAQQGSPSGLSAAATPSAGGLAGFPQLAPGAQQQRGSPLGSLSEAATPPYHWGSAAGSQLGSALRSPHLSLAGTPQPDFGLAGGGSFEASSSATAHLSHAPTPLGLQGHYEIRYFSDGTDYLAPAGTAPGAHYGTPLAAQRTPPPGLPELQGNYSMQRLGEEEGWKLAGEATPPHPDAGYGAFIAAFPGSTARGDGGGGQESLSASKTPLLHLNPLAM